MMASAPVRQVAVPVIGQLELDELELLPCGCVIATQHAGPWAVQAVSVEAKGPYCPISWHRTDRVLRMGDPSDEFDGAADTWEPDVELAALSR